MINGKLLKICGMREADNIRRIGSVIHPDLMGFVFYPPSPRYAYCLDVASIDSLPDDMKRVGVFVNESLSVMRETAKRCHLDTLQFHGAETPVQCVQMREEGFCIIKAFSIGEADDLEAISDYEGGCDLFLFDTKTSTYGGSGRTFDWDLLRQYSGNTPFLLSGGIGEDSLEELRRFHHPKLAGYDLNSRFETSPGIKDMAALQRFCQRMTASDE